MPGASDVEMSTTKSIERFPLKSRHTDLKQNLGNQAEKSISNNEGFVQGVPRNESNQGERWQKAHELEASKIESSSRGDNVRKSSTVEVFPSFFKVSATLLHISTV